MAKQIAEKPLIDVQKWINKNESLPPDGIRVLTYSPIYKGIDDALAYRMMGSYFVKICNDVEWWMIPCVPDVKESNENN